MGFLVQLAGLLGSTWWVLRWVSWFDLFDCWVLLGGFALRWISWFDFLGSEVGLLDLLV